MIGMYSGQVAAANRICMKVSMSTSALITSHRVMRSLERIGFVTIMSSYKNDLAEQLLISSQILTSYPMSSMNLMLIIKNLNKSIKRRICGS